MKKQKQIDFKKVCLCVFKLLIKYFGKELLDYIVQLLLQDNCLEVNFYRVYLKHAHISKLPDLVRVQQRHSSCAFIEVISEGDAAVPGLDLTAASPWTDVNGFGTGQDFLEGDDVASNNQYARVSRNLSKHQRKAQAKSIDNTFG